MEEIKNSVSNETTNNEVAKVNKFLLTYGFTDVSFEVLTALSKLIVKNIKDESIVVRKECARTAANMLEYEAMRSKIGYYIKKNFERVRKNIFEAHNYDIGKYCSAVKGFIEQMVIVYCVFERDL